MMEQSVHDPGFLGDDEASLLGRSSSYGPKRQRELLQAGQGSRVPVSPEQMEEAARARLRPDVYAFFASGAGAEDTVRANRAAFGEWRIVPRMLRNVSRRDLSVELFGRRYPAPLLLAPIGVQGMAHPEGEVAVARAAASLEIPYVLSSVSSRTLEDVALAMGNAPRWFQLYWSNDRELAASFISRAERAGYGALVVTLDTCLLGWRYRDLQIGFFPQLQGQGIANYLSDPVFRRSLARPPEADLPAAVGRWVALVTDPSLTWDHLAWLRDQTRLPILLKGILHPDDALQAIDRGMDGIVVSNHGGRQVDGAIAALDALPPIVDAVRGRLCVLFDSGIRGGADVVKAIALGASAVLLGRPYIWGLVLAGEDGVREVVCNLLGELDNTLALSGHASVAEVSRVSLVWWGMPNSLRISPLGRGKRGE